MSNIQTTWYPGHLVNGYFNQIKFWISGDGEVFNVEEMHPMHCLNAILYLERCAPQIYLVALDKEDCEIDESAKWLYETPLYTKIKERVVANLNEQK